MRSLFQRASISILAICATIAASAASGGQTHYEGKAVADAMVNRFVDAWNRADGAAYGENYWPEAELVDPSGAISTGRAKIVQEHVQLWAGIFKGSHITGRVRRIQVLCPNFMVVDFDAQVSGLRRPPPGSPPNAKVLKNHLKHILEKRNGVWKVLSAQNTFIVAHK